MTVADLVMQRIVVPPYVGSNPIGHLINFGGLSLTGKAAVLKIASNRDERC